MKLLIILLSCFSIHTANATTEFTVHHAPGGPSDKTTRIIHKYLPDNQYVIANRPGALGKIAVKHVIAHDSLMLATMAQIYVNNKLAGVTDYDPDKDLKVIASIGTMPSVLVCRSDLKLTSIPDVIKSDKLSFAVAGIGSSEHLATEVLFNRMNKRHLIVPYASGGSKSVLDILGGHVDCMFANYPTVKEWVNDKRLTVLLTSHQLGLTASTWESLYNEKFPFNATLAIIVGSQNSNKQIVSDLRKVMSNKQFIEELVNVGIFPTPSTELVDINKVLKNNISIKDVIVKNNITIK
jgi:tripartite-type tricarboxylate transporter receptor subunit TctC